MLRLVQLRHSSQAPGLQSRGVAVVEEPHLRLINNATTIHDLATRAISSHTTLIALIQKLGFSTTLDYDPIYSGTSEYKLLSPIDHPEPSRLLVTGTGLTHKASAASRQSMHSSTAPLTDSMKMYQIGEQGGRPAPDSIGAEPEWFYKGPGSILRAPNQPLDVPPHALDGGEEAEIAGVYLIGPNGTPHRIGLTQSNEFSDHILESQNYLYLASSKLRTCSLGPELVVNAPFDNLAGQVSVERDGQPIWQSPLVSGESHMCHTLANLEHHHFKHLSHRGPGDLHVHFLGANVFSFRDKLQLRNKDVMVVSYENFGRPLRNPLRLIPPDPAYRPITVKSL